MTSGKDKAIQRAKRSVVARNLEGMGGCIVGVQEIFRAVNFLYGTAIINTC